MKYVQNIFASRKLERLTSSYYSFYTSAFKKRDPLIDSKLEEWIRFDEDYYYIPEYRGTIQQYLHYLAIKNNKNTDLSNLIILADEQLKGNTKEIALFDLVLLAVRSGNVKTEDVFAKYMTYAPNGFLKEYVEQSFKSQILAKRLGVGTPCEWRAHEQRVKLLFHMCAVGCRPPRRNLRGDDFKLFKEVIERRDK